MTKPFTEASNLPLSPLVALLAIGTMSPAIDTKATLLLLLLRSTMHDTSTQAILLPRVHERMYDNLCLHYYALHLHFTYPLLILNDIKLQLMCVFIVCYHNMVHSP